MDNMMIPILIALTVALVGFGLAQFIASKLDGEKRRLKQRLAGEARDADVSAQARSIVLREQAETGIGGLLIHVSIFETMSKRLTQAYPDMTLSKLMMFCSGLGIMGFVLGFMLTSSFLIGGVATAGGFYLPMLIVNGKRTKRQRMLADELPEALDFLSRVLRAGHSLSTGLQMMGEELPQPLASEFARAYAQHSLGNPLEDCLKDMSKRIESTDFAFFVTAVLIQRQTGGDLSEVLGNISGMIRNRIRLQQHVKAKTAEGRFTGYILSAFPIVMFFIAYSLNPGYAGILIHDSTGIMLLCIAGSLELMGLFCIKKITTVTV